MGKFNDVLNQTFQDPQFGMAVGLLSSGTSPGGSLGSGFQQGLLNSQNMIGQQSKLEDLRMRTGILQQEQGRRNALPNRGVNLGLNPVYTTDAGGNLSAYQMNPAGGVVPIQFPEGQQPVNPMSYQNAGNMIYGMPKYGGAPVPAVPVTPGPESAPGYKAAQVEATTAAKAAETRRQGAISDLPGKYASVNKTIDLVDQMLEHPGLPMAVGPESLLPAMPGSERAGFDALYGQIQGKIFEDAYQTLKGAGTITETETAQAIKAKTRMSTATSEAEFRSAAKDFKSALKQGLKILEKKAGVVTTTDDGWTVEEVR